MKRKRETGANLALRLAQRECCAAPPAAAVARSRRLYENLAPTTALPFVEPPPGMCICRFTPCGRFLVSFDVIRNEVVLHRFTGLHRSEAGPAPAPAPAPAAAAAPAPAAADASGTSAAAVQPPLLDGAASRAGAGGSRPPPQPPPPAPARFQDAFEPHARCAVGAGPHEQLLSLCLVAHDAFLVVASTSPETEPLEPEGWLPVTDCTHLHLLRISDGAVLDRVTLHAECALGCGGASLWGDLLTVVAAAPQTVFMLRVLPSGRFVLLHALGQHCMDDDVLVLEEHEEAERRWRAAHPGRQLPAPAPAPAPPRGAARAGGGGQREEEQEEEQQQQQLAPGAAGAAAPMLEGLKQRMLAHLYTHAAREARAAAGAPAGGPSAGEEGLPAGPRALDAFHYFFKSYEEMTIARAQLLDRERLLIHWAPSASPAAPAPRRAGASRGMRMVFNTRTAAVEALFLASSPAYLKWSLSDPCLAHGGSPCGEWERFVGPGLWAQERFAKDPARAEALRAGSCQARQASPFLDPELFQFDDRFVSPEALPRPLPHRAAKFVARAAPERLAFKFDPDHVRRPPPAPRRVAPPPPAAAPPQPAGGEGEGEGEGEGGGAGGGGGGEGAEEWAPREVELEVVYVFHPVVPFAIAAVEDTDTGIAEGLTFYTRL